ncbi:MAG: carbohydrate ABC transporter permease [Actinobacteria bacterium]|nr:carbohydrate ABC transporter permease [Actinomycetota bacterium]
MKHTSKITIYKIIGYFIIAVALIITFYPIVVALVTSFKPKTEILTYPPTLMIKNPTLEGYKSILFNRNFLKYGLNSLIISLSTTFFSVSVGSLAAYALSRYRFFGDRFISQSVLLVYMFPPALLVIPLYLLFYRFNLIDNIASLIIAYITFSLPLCIWLLKGFFDGLPKELDDSARIDGCSEIGILLRIIFPISAPGILSAGAFSFMLAWMEYMFAITFITSQKSFTLMAGLANVLGFWFSNYSALMAAAILASIPAIVLFFVAQKYIIKGLVSGAVKG